MVRLTDRLDMTIVVDWDVKPQNKQTVIVLCLSDRSQSESTKQDKPK